jgi:hypothetical protein
MKKLSDCWLDITPDASAYEIGFHPPSMTYRHRRRSVVQTSDPSIVIVLRNGSGEWANGLPSSPS